MFTGSAIPTRAGADAAEVGDAAPPEGLPNPPRELGAEAKSFYQVWRGPPPWREGQVQEHAEGPAPCLRQDGPSGERALAPQRRKSGRRDCRAGCRCPFGGAAEGAACPCSGQGQGQGSRA
eukprot:3705423-Alexandrium_andersonii.AAC.1